MTRFAITAIVFVVLCAAIRPAQGQDDRLAPSQVVRNDLSLPRAATALGLRVQFNF